MISISGPYRWGIVMLLVTAALHVFAFGVGNFASEAMAMIVYGIIYALLAVGLGQAWRWLAYIAFFALFIGGIGALAELWSSHPVPAWWFAVILVVNWLGAVAMFVALWRDPPASEASEAV